MPHKEEDTAPVTYEGRQTAGQSPPLPAPSPSAGATYKTAPGPPTLFASAGLNVLLGDCQLTTQGSQTLSQVGSSRRERNTPKDLTETRGLKGVETLV